MTPAPQQGDTHPFAPFLQEGEQLLWVGRPNATGYYVQPHNINAKISGLIVLAIGIGSALLYAAEGLIAFWHILVFVGIFVFAFVAFLAYKTRNDRKETEWYALTSKRLMTHDRASESPFQFLMLNKITQISLAMDDNEHGNVRCHVRPFTAPGTMHLKAIDNALEVCQQITATAERDIDIVIKL